MSNWNLKLIYENDEAFYADLEKIKELCEQVKNFQGKLHNFEDFKNYLLLDKEIDLLLNKVYQYTHLAFDLNMKDPDLAARMQQINILINKLSQDSSYIDPEIISIGQEKIMSFIESDEEIKEYKFPFIKLFKNEERVFSDKIEKIISTYKEVTGPLGQLYSNLAVADASGKEFTDSEGNTHLVNSGTYTLLLQKLSNQSDRKKAFETMYDYYDSHKNTFAGIYSSILRNDWANARVRNYSSSLESYLDRNNIPVSVYESLINTVRENTHVLKRYINLRKKFFKLDEYHTYDRLLDFVKNEKEYEFEEAKKLFFESIKVMPEEFIKKQHMAVEDGYVDVYYKEGKRSGAYSSSTHNVRPFILLNHNKSLDSVFTLAHEAGHSGHSLFSCENQPQAISRYTIFVAEIASTFNEHLLLDHLIKTQTNVNEKIETLANAIDGITSTFFRQTLFANYEYLAHKLIEDNKPVTEKDLSNIMIELYKDYYGIDLSTEELKKYVWAYIPHFFYTPFYVYQYATCYAASSKIFKDIKNNVPNALENYLTLLKSGGNDYPINQCLKAGVDLTKPDAFLAVIERFNGLVDELEHTLDNL